MAKDMAGRTTCGGVPGLRQAGSPGHSPSGLASGSLMLSGLEHDWRRHGQ